MKIILSRKGFDSSNGGVPSPIMPDGTLLSMPIPTDEGVCYSDIAWNGITYADILNQLCQRRRDCDKCHLDPDIRNNRILPVKGWQPAFGQHSAAQGVLKNSGIDVGDIFLFFGWFKRIVETDEGYRFARKSPDDFYAGNDLQVIYGYMQIGEIITDQERIKDYYWHPHASKKFLASVNNILYLPTKQLSLNPSLKGYGTLDYRKDRVLTMEGMGRATWNNYSFLQPDKVLGEKKNSAIGKGLYYKGIWQELVVPESRELIAWVKSILE